MTRIEFERKCNEVGLYSFAIGNVEREGEHFRAGLKLRASMKCQRIETEKVSAWVRRLGWGACIANGIAKPRRSPTVHEGKGRQEQQVAPRERGRSIEAQNEYTITGMETEIMVKEKMIEMLLVAATENEQQVRLERIAKRKRG